MSADDEIERGRLLAESGKHTPVPENDDAPLPSEPPPDNGQDDKPGRRSVAAQLVDLARAEYSLGLSDTDEPYGVSVDCPHIALMLRGGRTGLRVELARRYFADHNMVASQQALADACMVLEGFAARQTPQPVYLRVGEHNGAVYIDTGDTEGRVIRISGGGWRPTDTAPILFRRTKLTGQMAEPVVGSDLSGLWEFVTIDEADRPVLLAWLVAVLILIGVPHPILALLAEQGSAKSSITRCLVDLVDPSAVPLRQPPRDPDGWTTAASASWVVALDNLSGGLPAWLSDALCRAVTGDGNVKRALYTDNDVSVSAFRRCPIINGVDVIIGRGDVAERLAVIELPRVKRRRDEGELAQAWQAARPQIFGGLLDLAAQVHRRLPNITVTDLPRMADFARVLAAVDEVLGTNGLTRYRERSKRVAADTLDDPFIAELVECRAAFTDKTSVEILAALKPADLSWKPPREWPKNARAVTGQLTRHAPALRGQGWAIDHDDGRNEAGIRKWTIGPPEKVRGPDPSDPSDPSIPINGWKSDGSETGHGTETGYDGTETGYDDLFDPSEITALTTGNGSTGQAGHDSGPSLVVTYACQFCGAELKYSSARSRGHCSRATCLAAARELTGGR
jgi:hypothetical protein